jgi:hypothetical protein
VKEELVCKDHLLRAIDRSIDFKFLREVPAPVPGAVAPGATGCGYRPSPGQALLPGHQFSPDCTGAGCGGFPGDFRRAPQWLGHRDTRYAKGAPGPLSR